MTTRNHHFPEVPVRFRHFSKPGISSQRRDALLAQRTTLAIMLLTFLLLWAGNSMCGQGLTGPSEAATGSPVIYTYYDDVIIAEPNWRSSNATIVPRISGNRYEAQITWSQAGDQTVEFRDGTVVLASMSAMVTEACTYAVGAGVDRVMCGQQSVTLSGSAVPAGGTGRWSVISGTGGVISSPDSPGSSFSGSIGVNYVLRWSVTIGICGTLADDVRVTFQQPPSTRPDVSGNVRFGSGSLTLLATGAPTGAAYVWRSFSPVAAAEGASFITPVVAQSQPSFGEVRFRDSNGCFSPATAVALTIEPMPRILPDAPRLVMGEPVQLTTPDKYDSYRWTDDKGTILSTAAALMVSRPVTIFLSVTRSGVTGTGNSLPVTVLRQFDGAGNVAVVDAVLKPGVSDPKAIDDLTVGQRVQQVHHADGLGRVSQIIGTRQSPAGFDLLQLSAADTYGRSTRQYLPIVTPSRDGSFQRNILTPDGSLTSPVYAAPDDDVADDLRPFREVKFEPSPLNRITSVQGEGQAWQDNQRAVKYTSTTNQHGTGSGQEQTAAWRVDQRTGMPVRDTRENNFLIGGWYRSGMLRMNAETDEEGRLALEYFDRAGRLILKKEQAVATPLRSDHTHWIQTTYIYDDLGLLRYVFQPELTMQLMKEGRNPTAYELAAWGFRYRYDAFGRMIVRQEPGRDSVYLVYDSRNRVVLQQDGNQRAAVPARWTFFKYDFLSRAIASGIKDTSAVLTQAAMQEVVNTFYRIRSWASPDEQFTGSANAVHGYTNRAYPVVNSGAVSDPNQYLTVSYYDDYGFLSDWASGYDFRSDQLSEASIRQTGILGKPTGGKEKVLDGGIAGGTTWLRNVIWYDDRYRVIQRISDNYKGGTDIITTAWDFSDQVLRERTAHSESDVTWKDAVAVTPLGNKLVRTNAAAGWTAGAVSAQILPAGQDGWMEFTAVGTQTVRAVGLSDVNSSTNFNTIDYAVYLNSNATVSIFEQALGKMVTGNFGTYRSGDVFRIQRTAGVIRYYRNGALLYTSVYPSSTVLMADIALNTPESVIAAVRCSFSTTSQSVVRRWEYDHAGRVTREWHQLNGGTDVLLSATAYNPIGQPVNRKLHAHNSPVQSVDYRYHIRGWIASVNSSSLTHRAGDPRDLFGIDLGYENNITASGTGRFDGLLSSSSSSFEQGYGNTTRTAQTLDYDPAGRLLRTAAADGTSAGNWTTSPLEETLSGYDANGNLRGLSRKFRNGVQVDNLSYTYASGSNRLGYIQDNSLSVAGKPQGFFDGNPGTAADYSYDRNGNVITDLNRGITVPIVFNALGTPEIIQRADNRLHIITTATGKPLARVQIFAGTGNGAPAAIRQTDLCGIFRYDNDQLQQIDHSEGRVMMQGWRMLFQETGSALASYQPTGALATAVTLNGAERYIYVSATSTTARSGVSITSSITAQAGERYLIRVRGYRAAGTAKSSNPVYVGVRLNSTDLVWPGAALPMGSSAEHAVEQLVTIPAAGAMSVSIGWGTTVLVGEGFYLNQVEVIRVSASAPDYQYFLRDQLGNVRVTFTAEPKTDQRTATLEPAALTAERPLFQRTDNARRVTSVLFDRTHGILSGTAARLNGSTNERYGMAVSLAVMPGDVVSAETFAKYVDPNSASWTSALSSLMMQVATGSTTVVTDGASYSSSTSSFPFAGLLASGGGMGTGPRFYINWLVFDRDYNHISAQSGYTRLSATPREYGQDVPHERLSMPPVTIRQPGYIYIYVSNEELTPVEVYYDDFRVTHQQSPVLQSADYLPFGTFSNYYERENTVMQPVLFGSREFRRELGLDEYDFGSRWYAPGSARAAQQDPLATRFEKWSPYSWAGNDPANKVDPDGRDWYRANGSDGKMDPNGMAEWHPGSVERDGFTNIGSRFTFSLTDHNGSQVSYTFDQLEFIEKTELVMPLSGWMTQSARLNPRGCSTCCYLVSRDMVAGDGVKLERAYSPGSLTVMREQSDGNGKRFFHRTKNYQQGLDLLNAALDRGRPVVVGVDHSPGTRNIDGITDHFIVIAARITDVRTGAVSYRYLDPAYSSARLGTSETNILREVNGMYRSDHYFGGTTKHYTLSHVVK